MLSLLPAIALAADLTVGPAGTYATLEAAFDDALDGDRLLVEPGSYSEPALSTGARALIVEATAPGVALVSTSNRRAFVVDGGALTLVGVDFDGGDDIGLADVDGGSLTLQGVTVTNARAPIPGQPGGSIDAADATIVLVDSVLDGAVAPIKNGGHLYAIRSTVSLTGMTLTGGSAAAGGGIYLDEGSLTIDASTFLTNVGDGSSAIEALDADLVVTGSRFEGNAASSGHTVHCSGGAVCRFVATTFEENSATGSAVVASDAVGETTLDGVVTCRTSASESLVTVESGALLVRGTVFTSTDTAAASVTLGVGADGTFLNNSFVLDAAPSFLESDGPLELTNNLVASITGSGPAVVARGGLAGGYNLYFDNAGGDVNPAELGTDLVGVAPGIGMPLPDSCDLDALKPRYGSALIDGGDPSILDGDGSVSDIGAFGGKSPGDPGDPGDPDLDEDDDGFSVPADCDDTNPDISPGMPEVPCNGVDDDCAAATQDNVDADGDGVGLCDDDCDDSNADFFEIVEVYLDQDLDGFGVGEPTAFCVTPNNSAPVDGDCDDNDPTSFPGAVDVPYDGIDQDCDGVDLDDLDGDGALGAEDCDDEDSARYPTAEDVPDDGIDQDCSGFDVVSTFNGGAGWTCGCTTSASGGWLGLWGVLGLGLLGRRR